MKKKHFVSLALVLYDVLRTIRLTRTERAHLVRMISAWASLQADGFDARRFERIAETGETETDIRMDADGTRAEILTR